MAAAQRLADEIGAPLLASIPLEPAVALGGDKGEPAVLALGSEIAEVFAGLVRVVIQACPVVEMTGCSARLLEVLEATAASPASPH